MRLSHGAALAWLAALWAAGAQARGAPPVNNRKRLYDFQAASLERYLPSGGRHYHLLEPLLLEPGPLKRAPAALLAAAASSLRKNAATHKLIRSQHRAAAWLRPRPPAPQPRRPPSAQAAPDAAQADLSAQADFRQLVWSAHAPPPSAGQRRRPGPGAPTAGPPPAAHTDDYDSVQVRAPPAAAAAAAAAAPEPQPEPEPAQSQLEPPPAAQVRQPGRVVSPAITVISNSALAERTEQRHNGYLIVRARPSLAPAPDTRPNPPADEPPEPQPGPDAADEQRDQQDLSQQEHNQQDQIRRDQNHQEQHRPEQQQQQQQQQHQQLFHQWPARPADEAENAPPAEPLDAKRGHNVAIIRHRPHKVAPAGPKPTPLPSQAPSRLVVVAGQATRAPRPGPPTSAPGGQLVRLISKHRHKFDETVVAPTLTVVDHDAVRLPPNSTSVHNNKLVVALRPGRPLRRAPTTTQFPVYNIVAGITPPYASSSQHHAQHPARPQAPASEGAVYGMLATSRPAASEPAGSNFGAQNIKFAGGAELGPPMPQRLNVTIGDQANGSHPRPPDRIVLEPAPPPPADETLLIADTTLVRPATTTRRPLRASTTKRINIVSANTTVVATDPDKLHEVLTSVIANHQEVHHTHHHTSSSGPANNNNSNRPSFLSSLAGFFNAGVTTSLIAFLTLLKTIFVALLVMFLPPIALTTAIMQAVSLG